MNEAGNYFAPVTLVGKRVRLEPLAMTHLADLSEAGADESVWRWLPTAHHAPGSMASFIESAIGRYQQRLAVPFATIEAESSRAVGSTRFHCIEPAQRRLEIGVTWISPACQRSHINTEAKLLQLWYAFEVLACRRVEFKADAENSEVAQRDPAAGREGGGIFQEAHDLSERSKPRQRLFLDSLDEEWPDRKMRLLDRLGYDVTPAVRADGS